MSVSSTRVRVRYAETDQMGVAYHANYFVWFEVGRVELLRQIGFAYKEMESDDDCHIAVVEATCRYRSPARYDDELLVETRVTAVRHSVIRFAYRILCVNAGAAPRLLAEGETSHVVVDRGMTRSTLPEKYADALRAKAQIP
ncbi:MAG TPA: thioesterase family protein [Acidobacteriaceae bacterium]|jgi:acyl-CoA thioester hydrolase|nr:thioesterase family protein [Acidobacteriaceae bacterium]